MTQKSCADQPVVFKVVITCCVRARLLFVFLSVALECLRLLCQYFNATFSLFHNFAIFLFLGNCVVQFILVINKSASRCEVVRLNWTPLSPVTITSIIMCDCDNNDYYHNRIYNKIFDCDWFSARLFVT